MAEIKARADVRMDVNLETQLELVFGVGKAEEGKSSVGLKDALDILSRALPNWSLLRGRGVPSPVLIIDEANRLRALLEDQAGSATLNDFFAWIVRNTKQDGKFHVIMASSDSFFYRWVTQYVDSAYFRNFVIGHLAKEEAKTFWEEIVMPHDDGIPPLAFEKVYEVCGGCMHLLWESHRIHQITRGIVQPYSMSYVSLRRGKFIKMLHQSDLPWKQDHIITTMRLLVEQGYVGYNTLCKETSQKAIDAMIENNVVHLRPCAVFPFDIEGKSSEYPIVTPHLPCDLILMKELLHQFN